MMSMGDKDKKIAKLIVANMPREREVKELEPDFEDVKDAAYDELIEAIESKDKVKLKSSLEAIFEMLKEEEVYDQDEVQEVEG
jgi:hypothetical protein